jgi:hypothetical protein
VFICGKAKSFRKLAESLKGVFLSIFVIKRRKMNKIKNKLFERIRITKVELLCRESTGSSKTANKRVFLNSQEISKMVSDFMNENKFSTGDIEEFFENECDDFNPEEIGSFQLHADKISAKAFIDMFKNIIAVHYCEKILKENLPVMDRTPLEKVNIN